MEVSGQDTFLCKICNNFASRYYSKVLRHIELVHLILKQHYLIHIPDWIRE